MGVIYYAVNQDGTEICCNCPLYKGIFEWFVLSLEERSLYCYEECGDPDDCIVKLPKGTIEKLFGRKITWEHYPIKIEF